MSVSDRVRKKKEAQGQFVMGPDGRERSRAEQVELSSLAANTFKTKGSQQFLTFLKSITINRVTDAGITDAELRHLEGQRYLVGVIERMVHDGRNRKYHD